MSVKRNKDGSISIRNSNGLTSIGMIKGVFNHKHNENYQQWVEDCAKAVSACAHSFNETVQFFLQQCETQPIDANDERLKSFQYSVVMSHFKDKLENQSINFSIDMTDDEIEKWQMNQEDIRREVMNASPEHFGIRMFGYFLPQTERNSPIYEEAIINLTEIEERTNSHPQCEIQDIYFYFEETTEHIQCMNGGENLMNQIIIFRGVRDEDIKLRNPRFLGYLNSMRRMGSLPDFSRE